MNAKPIFGIRLIAILSFFFFATTAFSQDKSVIFIGVNGKLTILDHAVSMQKISIRSPRVSTVQTFILKDSKWKKISTEEYKRLNDTTYQIKGKGETIQGTTIRTFIQQAGKLFKFNDKVKGKVIVSGSSTLGLPLLLHGQVTEYYPKGNKKSVSVYNNNELVSNENWNRNGDKYIDNIFYSVDTFPTFNPGNKVINEQILRGFKDASIDVSDISGSIIIGFVVMEDGTIDGVKIIKGLGRTINSVACESIAGLNQIGLWTPAWLNNQKVRYFQVFPINFISKQLQFDYAEMRGRMLHFSTSSTY